MKDYHDLLLLAREPHMIKVDKLQVSLKNTFSNRRTNLELIDFKEDDLKPMEKLWIAHLKNLGNSAHELKLPGNIQDVIVEINKMLKNFAIC